MGRWFASGLIIVALAVSLLPASAGASDSPQPEGRSTGDTTDPIAAALAGAKADAIDALDAAKHAFENAGTPEGEDHGHSHDVSTALADLAVHFDDLAPAEQAEALALINPAPQVDPDAQRSVRAASDSPQRLCSATLPICVHFTTSGQHAVQPGWPEQVVDVMEQVWRHHIDGLGYRRPLPDGTFGGDNRFDVYLENLAGAQGGLYGYCAPRVEMAKRRQRVAPGFCVLENDFAEFPDRSPLDNLRVTAAHEFFHAIQYAYDFTADSWLKESTATWIEERFADDVDDNRQFLKHGQVARPARPLDHTLGWYGNWAFFEHLSARHGNAVVRRVWNQVAADRTSVRALQRVLRKRGGGFPQNYARFAAHNTMPARFYEEGAAWPSARVAGNKQVRRGSRARRSVRFAGRVRHLSSRSYTIRVNTGNLKRPGRWRLRLALNGPAPAANPAAHLLLHLDDGRILQRPVRFNRNGVARAGLKLRKNRLQRVTVTVANASVRYRACGSDPSQRWTCGGIPRDRNTRFVVEGLLVRR